MAELDPIIVDTVEPIVKVATEHSPGKIIIEVSGNGFDDSRVTLCTNIGITNGGKDPVTGMKTSDIMAQREVWSGTMAALVEATKGDRAPFVELYSILHPLFMQTVRALVANQQVVLKQVNKIE